MDESSMAIDSSLSLNDSSKASSDHLINSEMVEKLKRRLRELESENLELKRAFPHMKDVKGDNCKQWMIKISNELEAEKTKYRESQNKLAALDQQFRAFREHTERRTCQSEKEIAHYRQKTEELEEKIDRLNDRLRDDQSLIYHLKHGDYPQQEQQQEEEENASGGGRRSRSAENFEECLRQIDERSEGRQSPARSPPHSGRGEQHLAAMEGITLAMFDKLRSSANVFMQLLTKFGNDVEVREVIESIKNMKLDLNKSVEAYHKKIEEYQRRSAPPSSTSPSSAETSFRDRAVSKHHCSRCKLVESERDTLRIQLNREIGLKDELQASKEKLEQNAREMGRQVEEMSSQLEQSQRRVEELKQRLQRSEQYHQNRYDSKMGAETAELNDKLRMLRQRNMELDTRNEELVREMRRLKQVSQEEATNKEAELQCRLAQLERLESGQRRLKEGARELEERCRQLDDQYQQEFERRWHVEKEAKSALEAERRTHGTELRKMAKKLENVRQLLAQYSHYFDNAVEYERLVAESADLLENKLLLAKK